MTPEFKISDDPKGEAATYILATLKQHLEAGEKVLWLVPGGSAILIAVEVAHRLKGIDCSKLSITLTDERYGAVGHADSSYFQLENAGFSIIGATIYPVLSDASADETLKSYSEELKRMIEGSDYSIGLFGIGADGHTAGILPMSPAALSLDIASGYQGGQYYRITIAPSGIAKLDEVVVYAVGAEKEPALEKLNEEHTLAEQPAQALKQATTFIIYKGR